VAASGLVNSREHLESLVVAKQMGVPSVQAYLRNRADASGAALEQQLHTREAIDEIR
jgi:hypothetical protein